MIKRVTLWQITCDECNSTDPFQTDDDAPTVFETYAHAIQLALYSGGTVDSDGRVTCPECVEQHKKERHDRKGANA